MQIKSVRVWTCFRVNFTQYEANARPEIRNGREGVFFTMSFARAVYCRVFASVLISAAISGFCRSFISRAASAASGAGSCGC